MTKPGLVLRRLLKQGKFFVVPCAHDALSARLIQRSGHFTAVFNSGFAIAASHGLPDTGLLSFAEILRAHTIIRHALPYSFPVLADGDDGYGNAMNVKRTVKAFDEIGIAAIMIEDQVSPKQCGHTIGKQVVSRDEAVQKIRAAVDARNELRHAKGCISGAEDDILILARTDSRAIHGIDEAIEKRCRLFEEEGADILFLEAPESKEEMALFCKNISSPKMANCLTKGVTPNLAPSELAGLGYSFAAYPFDILLACIDAIETKLKDLCGFDSPPKEPDAALVDTLWEVTGFRAYMDEQRRYGCQEFKSLKKSSDSS